MKKRLSYRYVLVCATILFINGCTQEIDLNELRPEPQLVLNSVAVAGEPITASVSKTWFFTDENPNITIKEADVSLFVNDRFQEKLTWVMAESEYNSKGYFQSAYLPVTGDKIEIKASVENYKEVSAGVSITPPCPILDASADMLELHSEENGYGKYKLSVTFRDDPARQDYYLFLVEGGYPLWDEEKEEYTDEYEWEIANIEYKDEPLFAIHITPLEKILGYDWLSMRYGRVFTDELISGKEYTLQVSFQGPCYIYNPWNEEEGSVVDTEHPVKYRVNLYTIAEPYYRYMKSIIDMSDQNLHQQLVKAGLAELVSIYSNIKNGIGIVGSCNPSSIDITLENSRK